LEHLARTAFQESEKRRKKVALVLKTSVLDAIAELWEDVFEKESNNHPDVAYSVRPSGAGFSDMYLFPDLYDVVVTDDEGGDIIADVVPTMLYGSRNLAAQANLDRDGFGVYQTDHGTVKYLAGQDRMNPIGMISALAMALEYSYGMKEEADALTRAVNIVLFEGYRTEDMYVKPQHQKLVGTKEMTEKIIQRIT
jgi:3-isopropylmalate dehydrogenase